MKRARSAFVSYVRVRFHECDPLGHVNNAVYLGYLEQAAIDHAAAAGWPAPRLVEEFGAVFVARKHEIEFLLPSFENDILEITTWPAAMHGSRARRDYLICGIDGDIHALPANRLIADPKPVTASRGDRLVVQASTEWVLVTAKQGRPLRIPTRLASEFLVDDERED